LFHQRGLSEFVFDAPTFGVWEGEVTSEPSRHAAAAKLSPSVKYQLRIIDFLQAGASGLTASLVE
jgi:hypothetical protein